jgi:hypothetical protein
MSSNRMTNNTNSSKNSKQSNDPSNYELQLRANKEIQNGLAVTEIQDDFSEETPDIKISNIIG